MTREEAIEILCAYGVPQDEKGFREALDIAIEALTQDSRKVTKESTQDLISRSRAIKEVSEWATDILHPKTLVKEDAIGILESLPSVAAVEVVRCRDCKWYDKGENEVDVWSICIRTYGIKDEVSESDYCSWGERREDGEA